MGGGGEEGDGIHVYLGETIPSWILENIWMLMETLLVMRKSASVHFAKMWE